MAKGRKGKKSKKEAEEEAARLKLEREIIARIIHFYTNDNTTYEQRLKVWEAVEKIMLESPETPKPDDTGEA